MNKDSHLIFEAYKNRPVNENMPYPTFAKLSKHASPKSSKEKPTDEFKQQLPDSKEEYSAHDYAKEMEVRGEGEECGCVKSLAAKHNTTEEEIQQQLDMGMKVETEHTDDINVAKKIAMDHLNEDPLYYTKLAKMEAENEETDEEGDLMAHMKQQGMIAKDSTTSTGKYGHTREEEESKIHPAEKKYGEQLKARQEMEHRFKDWLNKKRSERKAKNYPQKAPYEVNQHWEKKDENEERRLDPKCWKGYHKQGTKLKDGKRVNNCVKNS